MADWLSILLTFGIGLALYYLVFRRLYLLNHRAPLCQLHTWKPREKDEPWVCGVCGHTPEEEEEEDRTFGGLRF